MTRPPPAPWQLTGSGVILLYRFPKRWVLEHGMLPAALRASFVGGVGAVMLVDYTGSDVGPYQEALFIPGQLWLGGGLVSSITRIFVSTVASVDGGRENWGIPKDLAEFQCQGDSFRVWREGAPLLQAEVSGYGPKLPFATAWSPLPLVIAQLRGGDLYRTRPGGKGALQLARVQHLEIDGSQFPDVSRFRPFLALRATDFQLTFPVSMVDGRR